MIEVAGAPVSFGVFDLGASAGGQLSGADEVCSTLSTLGYTGVDLGPLGFLGRGATLRSRLSRHGLSLAGGWIDLPFSDPSAFPASLPVLSEALDIFAEGAADGHRPPPLPTLADSGSELRRANPGGAEHISLDSEGWAAFARNIRVAAAMVRDRGFEPTFHHHACTHVETPKEIDRFLDSTDVGLTLDTGHLILAGGDPVEGLKRWGGRINHVHIKDARIDVLRGVVEGKGGMRDVWAGKAFVPLGEGDLEVDAFMAALIGSGYDGWLVVEQDTIPAPNDDPRLIEQHHAINRNVLRKWIP